MSYIIRLVSEEVSITVQESFLSRFCFIIVVRVVHKEPSHIEVAFLLAFISFLIEFLNLIIQIIKNVHKYVIKLQHLCYF
jgi:hypothetical protein